jgi:hypothetical protein
MFLGVALLMGADGGLFLPGLLILLVGVALLVRVLLKLTEASIDNPKTAPAGFKLDALKGISAMNQWVAGAIMGVLSLFGLFLYSRAADGMFATFGGLLFVFGLAVIVVLVHKATDYSAVHAPEPELPASSDQQA